MVTFYSGYIHRNEPCIASFAFVAFPPRPLPLTQLKIFDATYNLTGYGFSVSLVVSSNVQATREFRRGSQFFLSLLS
jgi:hypothetical protein